MHARVPLDVDLEDRLVYGLTPLRLAYMVLAVLGALAIWSSGWPPAPVRGFLAAIVLLLGATLAWGRWRGRPADGWVSDFALFVAGTRRLTWDAGWRPTLRRIEPQPLVDQSEATPEAEVAAA
jgi:hypothetical protein